MEEKYTRTSSLYSFFSGLLPLFVITHFAHHLLTALLVPLLPMIRTEFAIDYTQSGLLISAFSLSYGLGQLPSGWLADHIGPRLLITMGICGVALAGFLVGLSPTFTMIIIFLIMMGLLGGGYHPAAPVLISKSVDPDALGRSLGLHVIGGSGSYFLSPIIGVTIAATWGWRGPFIGLAIPTVIFGAIFYILLGRRSKKAGERDEKPEIQKEKKPLIERYSQLAVIIILSTIASALLISVTSFIPLFLVDNFSLSEKTAAALLSIIYSTGLWAAPAGGYLSDRLGKVPVILTVCFFSGPAIYLLNLFPYGVGTWILLLLLGVSLYVRMPVTESYLISRTAVGNRSTILGIYYFSSMESGGLLTPVMGYLIDRFGFYASFSIAGAGLLIATLICSFWLWGERE